MRTMIFETGMAEKDIKSTLKQIEEKILYVDGWVCVKNFERHQVARGSSQVKIGVEKAKKEIPSKILSKIEELLKNKPKRHRVSIGSLGISTLDSDLDSDSDLDLDLDKPIASPSSAEVKKKKRDTQPHFALIEYFFQLMEWPMDYNIAKRYLRASRDLLEACQGNAESAKEKMLKVKQWADVKVLSWSIETVLKRWYQLDEQTTSAPKQAYIEGCRAYERNGDWWVINPDGTHVKWVGSLSELKYV